MQLQPLVPVHQFDELPSYYIFAGFVFIPLTQPYLHEFGEDWYNTSPRRLCERSLRELPKKASQQLVILSQVLLHYLLMPQFTRYMILLGNFFHSLALYIFMIMDLLLNLCFRSSWMILMSVTKGWLNCRYFSIRKFLFSTHRTLSDAKSYLS
jgi:hypothetical protein